MTRIGKAYKTLKWRREHAKPVPKLIRMCRSCGCTDNNACIHRFSGETCHWVELDLCSACICASERSLFYPPYRDPKRR